MRHKLDDVGGAKDLGSKINMAKEIRHQSDYDDFYIVSVSETAKEVVEAVRGYLEGKL